MVPILVVGLLTTIVIQSVRGASDKARRTKAQADIAELKTALDDYYRDEGYYPTTEQELYRNVWTAVDKQMFLDKALDH